MLQHSPLKMLLQVGPPLQFATQGGTFFCRGAGGAIVAAAAAAVVAGRLAALTGFHYLSDEERGRGWEDWLCAEDLRAKEGGVKEEEEGKAEGEGAVRVGKKDKRRVFISQTG